MASSPTNRFRKIGFGVLGLIGTVAGLAAAATTALDASVNDAHPNGINGLARGRAAALRQYLGTDLAPSRGATIAIRSPDRAERLLKAAPLDPTALTYLALDAKAKGDNSRADVLMKFALRNEERSLRPRLWFIAEGLRKRDYPGVIDNFDRLLRIGSPDSQALTVAMTSIVRDPASHAPLARKLATNPPWRQAFLLALNQQNIPADVVFRLTPQDSAKQTALDEQSALLRSLVKTHEYERAYLAWVNFLPESSLQQVGSIYDPSFEGLPGPLPFNWLLSNNNDGATEFRRPRGLTVSYIGQAPASLVEQTLMLAPGRYRLSTTATGADDNNQLAWVVTCADATTPLQSLSLTSLSDERKKYATTFEIPAANCGAQRLVLTGSPAEFPRAADAVIESVAIEAAR